MLSFDNLSTIKPSIADAFFRLATGGGFGTRKLHTNDEEMLFNVTRPCLLNGIPDLAGRPDLADRAIILNLPVISEAERRYEDNFWREFEAERPRILSGLLHAASGALARYEAVELGWRPRMADFARWVTAAEPSLGWPDGAFIKAYARNHEEVGDAALDGSSLAQAILHLVEEDGEWEGAATDLFNVLRTRYPALTADRSAFSADPNRLGNELRRVKPLLRCNDVYVTHKRRGHNRTRIINLKRG